MYLGAKRKPHSYLTWFCEIYLPKSDASFRAQPPYFEVHVATCEITIYLCNYLRNTCPLSYTEAILDSKMAKAGNPSSVYLTSTKSRSKYPAIRLTPLHPRLRRPREQGAKQIPNQHSINGKTQRYRDQGSSRPLDYSHSVDSRFKWLSSKPNSVVGHWHQTRGNE